MSSARITQFLTRGKLHDYVERGGGGVGGFEEGKPAALEDVGSAKDLSPVPKPTSPYEGEDAFPYGAMSPALQELEVDPDCVLAVREASFSWGVVVPLLIEQDRKKQEKLEQRKAKREAAAAKKRRSRRRRRRSSRRRRKKKKRRRRRRRRRRRSRRKKRRVRRRRRRRRRSSMWRRERLPTRRQWN